MMNSTNRTIDPGKSTVRRLPTRIRALAVLVCVVAGFAGTGTFADERDACDCGNGDPYTDTLVLEPSGEGGTMPNPDPWRPRKGSLVMITNNSGADQTLWDITPGLLNPAPGQEITIVDGDSWTGRVGNNCGTYMYNDGVVDPDGAGGAREGTIDPS